MDDREINTSIPNDVPESPTDPRFWRALGTSVRNAGLAVFAIGVVVGMHFGFPILVMRLVAALDATLDEIAIFFIALLAVFFLPRAVTAGVLSVTEATFLENDEFSIDSWPWVFAVPSVLALVALSTGFLWSGYVPQIYAILQPYQLTGMNVASWTILGAVIVLLFAELSLGLTGRHKSSYPKDTASEERRETDPAHNRSPPHRETILNETILESSELTYNWQRPSGIDFGDVGGMNAVKDAIDRRVLKPIRSASEAYRRFRVSPPTGILLYGPPGTGKSYLARSIAGELQSPYVELTHADLTSIWINESSMKIRRLFEEAEMFESCVIFIDEIDGLVQSRNSSGHNEDTKVVSEFLARLGEDETSYLIIAATNRRDQLDSAILRPGRFDEQFAIGLPDAKDRSGILMVQLRGRHPSLTDAECNDLAKRTEGMTAADIVAFVDDAALVAAENDANVISYDDLIASLPR